MKNASKRVLSGAAAINETIRQTMEFDQSVIVIGEDIAGGAGLGERTKEQWVDLLV